VVIVVLLLAFVASIVAVAVEIVIVKFVVSSVATERIKLVEVGFSLLGLFIIALVVTKQKN